MSDQRNYVKELFRGLCVETDPPYYHRPIPCDFDGRIANLVDEFIRAESPERALILSQIREDYSGCLFSFSDRMAALGVRERSYARLLQGLLALLIEGGKFDLRDSIASMALHYHSATRIGISPDDLFRDAASHGDNVVADEMLDFLSRRPEERNLKAMGYVEAYTEDGFRYEQAYKPQAR